MLETTLEASERNASPRSFAPWMPCEKNWAKSCSSIERRTARLVDGFRAAARAAGVPFTAASAGSLWGFFFHPGPVTDFTAAKGSDTALFRRFHRAARERGVLLAPSPFEAAFVSAAHDDAIIDRTIEALADALAAARKR